MTKKRVPVGRDNNPVASKSSRAEQTESGAAAAQRGDAEYQKCGCPVLEHGDWHEVESDWSDIAFVRVYARAFFGVILGYQPLLARAAAKAAKAGVSLATDPMALVGPGRFRRPVLVEVEGGEGTTGPSIVRPGGFAYTEIAQAPPGKLKERLEAVQQAATSKYGKEPAAMWAWYLTCMQCSADRDFETLFAAHFPDDH